VATKTLARTGAKSSPVKPTRGTRLPHPPCCPCHAVVLRRRPDESHSLRGPLALWAVATTSHLASRQAAAAARARRRAHLTAGPGCLVESARCCYPRRRRGLIGSRSPTTGAYASRAFSDLLILPSLPRRVRVRALASSLLPLFNSAAHSRESPEPLPRRARREMRPRCAPSSPPPRASQPHP
jgi:hypothetical protein